MTSPETPQYLISGGEVPLDNWALALQLLGKLGVNAIAVDATSKPGELLVLNYNLLGDGSIPYNLSDISSREQYLANEHLGEFWPEYRKNAIANGQNPGNKHEALCWGINTLTHPSKRWALHTDSRSEHARYAKELGLKVVSPRSLVGFSDKYSPEAYGLWNHDNMGDAVIEVGSFIDFAHKLIELPVRERPSSIQMPAVRLFVALADKLDSQIGAPEQDISSS